MSPQSVITPHTTVGSSKLSEEQHLWVWDTEPIHSFLAQRGDTERCHLTKEKQNSSGRPENRTQLPQLLVQQGLQEMSLFSIATEA